MATRTRVVIVRHYAERYRTSNTGRLAHLALPNSELVDHGGEDGSARFSTEGACLLFPGGDEVQTLAEPPRSVIVLDASWSQARRMFQRLEALRGLPRLRLPDAPMPAARFRASPAPGRVSTIEAIARALRVLEGDAVALPLEQLFALAVTRVAQSGRQLPP